MSDATQAREELVETLGDFIATKRDQFPRVPSDMDSWELAEKILEWFNDRGVLVTEAGDTETEWGVLTMMGRTLPMNSREEAYERADGRPSSGAQ